MFNRVARTEQYIRTHSENVLLPQGSAGRDPLWLVTLLAAVTSLLTVAGSRVHIIAGNSCNLAGIFLSLSLLQVRSIMFQEQ